MKKELLIMTMAIGMVAALTANGQQDEESRSTGRGYAVERGIEGQEREGAQFQGRGQRDANQEVITVEGILSLADGVHPYIEQDGITYAVAIGHYNIDDLNLTDGMTVSVEGFEVSQRGYYMDDTEKALMVTSAVIDGEEIEFTQNTGARGMKGSSSKDRGRSGSEEKTGRPA